MTSALEASGPKKYFFAFSILLDGLAHISAIFLLKMQKKSKIGSPYWTGPTVQVETGPERQPGGRRCAVEG
jgi:hypothetical protein